VEALETPTDAATAALLAGAGGVNDTTRLGGNETSLSWSPPSQNASATPTSSSLCRKGDATISINQHALSAIRDPASKVVFRNARPWSTGNGIIMVLMTVFHKEHGVDWGSNVYKCLGEMYYLLLRVDPTTFIPALYEDAYGLSSDSSFTSLENFLPDTMGLGNYVQISNVYTLSPTFGMDEVGNNKLQRPTWIFFRVKTMYQFAHLVGLIQSNLNHINVVLKEKDVPYLDTKTRLAIVGTTNEWCRAALKQVLEDAFDKHIESVRNKGGSLSAEFASREVPPFMIRKTKVRVSKLNKLGTEDAEFINYFEHLQNCNLMEIADVDWDWMWTLMLHFTAAGKMNRTISQQVSVLELHHGPQSSLTEVRFLKSLRLQMPYNHFYRTSNLGGVACVDYLVRVEVEPGHVPFKKTTLRRELMCMKLPPKEDRTLGDSFIDGAHCIFTGPERGHIRILYRNTDVKEAYVESFRESLAAYVYLYL
jgi:hypothetical protein